MEQAPTEASYPAFFRRDDARILGRHLHNRQSVALIGMTRVGISNFLRFFLYHPTIVTTYIHKSEKHIFIPVDLNDLVERELFPFWALTLKRITDTVERSSVSEDVKRRMRALFVESIQSQDVFLMIESVRRAVVFLTQEGQLPTIFFLRFDRIKDTINSAFFDNLQGLRDATYQQLSFVCTSFRQIDELIPVTVARTTLAASFQTQYLRPAGISDMKIVYSTFHDRVSLPLPQRVEEALFHMVGGNIQYLQLALITLQEAQTLPQSIIYLEHTLLADERITLQSEELWESLTHDEQEVALKVAKAEAVSPSLEQKSKYLWNTGFVKKQEDKAHKLFSPLIASYIIKVTEGKKNKSEQIPFTKKENLLFTLLKEHTGQICERESIIERVWPEYQEFGVSDWAIDRLVARVRTKLKQQKSTAEIKTIRTRGYQLVEYT